MRNPVSRGKKGDPATQVAIIPNLQPTCTYRIIALDPSIKGADGKALTSLIEIPNEELSPGPRGYRVQVIDYDASNRILYKPEPYRPEDLTTVPDEPEKDRAFHARNVYAIVMRVLARFERALGRRVAWSFAGHQLTIAPHAFLDLNAYYSKDDRAIYFGYYPEGGGFVFTSLSHEVIGHETTHALVDGLRNQYLRPSSPDQAAFHEAFADIVALLSVLSLREVVSAGLDLATSMHRNFVKSSKLKEG
jgi:Zn-dependent metalloprotease